MYENNYEHMVEAGVAVKLENKICMDKQGNEVSRREKEAYGMATKCIVTHPKLVIMVDECGCNTDQTNDGYVGKTPPVCKGQP